MKLTRKLSNHLTAIKKMELCPSLFNMYSERYSLGFLMNDVFSGMRIFMMLCPIVLALAFFCGASVSQGIISCAVAAIISAIFGGSKYQITSLAFPLCVVTFEILSKYQYKGLLFVAIFASIALIVLGLLRVGEVLKHLSYAFISALAVYVALSIIVNQAQYILDINTISSTQGLLNNISLFSDNFDKLTTTNLLISLSFLAPLLVIRIFLKSFSGFFVYLALGCAVAYASEMGMIPSFVDINTIGKEFISQNIDNIMNISRTAPSQTFLANTLNYSFAVALLIAAEASFCTSVASSITGDGRVQTNMELISSGISNFASVASGGLFVSPNTVFSLKNIACKAKTIVPTIVISLLAFVFLFYSNIILKYMPIYCISSILIVYSFVELAHRKMLQYFNPKNNDCYIFFATFLIAMFFGFIPAVIIGFLMSTIFVSKRLIKVKDSLVHTTKDHDTGAIEFMTKKNGFATTNNIPEHVLAKIEVIQISNMMFLNIAKVIEEALSARGHFPSVLIVYFKNVPFLDGDAFSSLKDIVKGAAAKNCITMICGTNGMLLDAIQQKADADDSKDSFGYIVPDFKDAINRTVKRLG